MYRYIIAFLLLVNICNGQEYIYKHFNVNDGLPSSQVYDMYQDKHGYIWFATDKGLSRYNGYEFENFTIENGLPDNVILNFFPQKNGQIWCYGYQNHSLFYFDEEFNGFKEYQHNTIFKENIKTNSIVKIIVLDDSGAIHIGGHNISGIIKITKEGNFTNRFEKTANIDNIPGKDKISIGIDIENDVLFLMFDEYKLPENHLKFKLEKRIISRFQFGVLNNEQYILISDSLSVISKDNRKKNIDIPHAPTGVKRIDDTHFFVGYYNNGAEIRDTSGAVIKAFLPKKSVTNFLIDKEGSYWFSTLDHGVFYVKNPEVTIFINEYASSLVKDNKNALYAGFNNGNILRIHNKKIDTIYKALNVNTAIVGFDATRNHFYGYSDGSFINYTLNKKTYAKFVRKIPENVGNPLLKSATNSYSIFKNDSVVRYEIEHKVQDVCMYNGEVLIGTSSGLFVHRNGIVKSDQSLDILKLRIDDIDINKKGNTAYMATHGAGVVVYGDRIYNIDAKHGLTNNIVSEVHIENDSIVWACTNSGLNRILFKPNKTFEITTISEDDGLLSNHIDDVEIVNDTVWVTTNEGLCFFKKEIVEGKVDSKIISFALINVKVNNKEQKATHIKLPHNQNSIDFSLQAISHKNTKDINYLYRLKEVDTNWTSTINRNIRFPSLSPGSYTFQAKASVLGNHSDDMVSYEFKILPPFWKTWWFYSLCILICGGIVYLFFKIRVFTYNKDIIRELIRLAIKRLKREEKFLQFRSNGEDFKIPTNEMLYIKSQGNYLDIITEKRAYTIRCKIRDFIATTPDTLEYLRVHRSYIIRIDQISSKGKNWVVINDQKIPVGETYLSQLEKIQF